MSQGTRAMRLAALLLAGSSLCARSSNLAGVWEGTYHRERGDRAVAAVFRPRGSFGFEGMFYLGGEEFGPIVEGRTQGDSVFFRATNYPFLGRVTRNSLALSLEIPHGSTHDFLLTFATPDTTALPTSFRNTPPASAPPAIPREPAPDSVYLAHALPRSQEPGTKECLRRGTLMLVGGGPSQADIQDRFVQLAGGARKARIVAIPTAHIETEAETELGPYSQAIAHNFGVAQVDVLHTFSRKEADSEGFVEKLKGATGVWIDGGEGSYLLNAYMGTRTERELLALLDRGGVIGGSSAGALIWGSSSMVFRYHPGAKFYEMAKPEDILIGHSHEPVIGVLKDVLVVPHFTEFKMGAALAKMIAAYPGLVGLGIDEATALEVHGDTCKVLGRGAAHVFRGNPSTPLFELREGARLNLKKLELL